jgi:hypothetical protein
MEKEPSFAIKKLIAEKDAEIDRLKSLLIRMADELYEARKEKPEVRKEKSVDKNTNETNRNRNHLSRSNPKAAQA